MSIVYLTNLIKKLPYNVTVSARGIANGLSYIPNDGADFGPDTMLGATSPYQYGPPYTQTSGIQEAINYLMQGSGGTMVLRAGTYIISAPWQQDPNSTDHYFQIGIPPVGPTDSTFKTLRIVCEGSAPIGYSYPGGGTSSQPNDLVYAGATPQTGVQLLSTATLTPSDTAQYSVLYVMAVPNHNLPNNINFVDISIEGALRVTIQPGYAISAMNFYLASHIDADVLVADLDLSQSNVIPNPANAVGSTSSALIYSFVGIAMPAPGNQGGNHIKLAYIVGYYSGIFIESHNVIDSLYIQSCTKAITLFNAGHASVITYANVQQCPVTVHNHLGSGQTSKTDILMLDMEVNYGITSGPEEWMNFVTDYETDGGNWEGIVRYHKQGVNATTQNLTTFYMSQLPSSNFRAECVDGNYPPSTPSVPSSGTAQQNTNPYPVEVALYGGTVTQITITRNGTTYTVFSNSAGAALSGQTYRLNPGDSITLTYSSAPTWTWLPA